MPDHRVESTWRTHPKTIRLYRQFGAEGPLALVALWGHARDYHPDGDISELDDLDLAAASHLPESITGEQFRAALLDARWLDADGMLHDWEEWNPWAIGAKARKEKAQKAARARWERRFDAPSNAPSITEHAPSNAPLPSSPVLTKPESKALPQKAREEERLFEELWKEYPRKLGKVEALKHFRTALRRDGGQEIVPAVRSAIANYVESIRILGTEEQYVLHGSTFFNNRWQDYRPGIWKRPSPPGRGPKPSGGAPLLAMLDQKE